MKEGDIRKELEEERMKVKRKIQERVKFIIKEQEDREIKIIGENRGGVWNLIKKISGDKKSEKDIKIIDNGTVLDRNKGDEAMCKFWEELYWDEGKSLGEEYKEVVPGDGKEEEYGWEGDHTYAKAGRNWKRNWKITEEEVNVAFKGLESNKAPGLSELTSKMWKAVYGKMGGEVSVEWMNEVVKGKVPSSWKRNKVVMVKKVDAWEVGVKDFRPITITEVSYKLFGSVMKCRLWEHLERNKLVKTEQSGFSRGRQIEENVLALRLEIERVRERKGELYVAALDVCKAFDSVDREVLVDDLRSIGWDER